MKILLVEDNMTLEKSLTDLFTSQEWEVITASSYKKALKLIKEDSFNLYIIDVLLPDGKGYELLKCLNKNSESRFILVSGFFNSTSILKYIPNELQELCSFIKKPIDPKKLLEHIHQIKKESLKNKPNDLYKDFTSQPLKSFLSSFRTFDAQELLSILFLALRSKFSGTLELHLNNKQKHTIEFIDGFISKVISENAESYFGALLIEHGLLSSKDIQKNLENKNSQYLGEQLVEQSLLSPHMLNFILKEQIKIRLTQIISHLSFSITISEEKNLKESSATVLNFDNRDLMEWAICSLKTKIKDSFLKSFYVENKYYILQSNHDIHQNILNNKSFIKQYINLLKKITKDTTLEDLLKNSKNFREDLELIYFGVITKSIDIINLHKKNLNNKKTEQIINCILQNKENNLFQILNIPWKSSKEEVEKSYRELIKIVHPDKVPPNSSTQLTNQYKEAFQKIQESHKILSDTNKREAYLKNQESELFLNTLSVYEKGINLIKSNKPEMGLNLLTTIQNHNHAPSSTFLYILWAKIQLAGDIYNNKEKAGFLKQEIEKCPLDQKVSPLFWFVTGLYYKKIQNYEKALTLFNKTILLKKNFREANQEIVLTKRKIKEELKRQNNNVFSRFFNKKSS